MMKTQIKHSPISFTLAGAILLMGLGCGKSPDSKSSQDSPGHQEEPVARNGETPDSPPSSGDSPSGDVSSEDGQALKAMGYMIGHQVGVQVGYTEEELEYVISGIRQSWETGGTETPPDLQEHLDRAKAIVQKKRKAFLQKQSENADKESIPNIKAGEDFLEDLSSDSEVNRTASGLHYKILAKGEGKIPKETDWVKVNYRGTLIDGTEFDSSYTRNAPGEFALNRVVKGWTEGLQLIGEGGKIKLYVPSSLGYGNSPRAGGKIKPGDLLVFDIELLEVTGEKKPPQGLPVNIPPPPSGPPPGFPPTRKPPDFPRNVPKTPPSLPPGTAPPPGH